MFRRLGNKSKYAKEIISKFPSHKVYYELFMGSGSIFFQKPKSQYSILNDLDSDVFNLFIIIKDSYQQLLLLLKVTPVNEELFYYWKKNKESDPVKQALRFLYLSSFSYLGKSDTFRLLHSDCSYKEKLEKLILFSSEQLKNTMVRNKDFRFFFSDIYVSDKHIGKADRFIYADPPYLETENNYNTPLWTKKDSFDLFNTLQETGMRFAMSEFRHPFILEEASKRKLNIISIKERRNIKNRKTEILITNYNSRQYELFK
jgi:DNA adenine methylase